MRLGLCAWVLAMMILAGCAVSSQSDSAPRQLTIVALGDSLTAGYGVDETRSYPAELERALLAAGRNVTVINLGVNGDTSADVVRRMDAVLTREPDIVVLAVGANDLRRGVPPEELKRNLETSIDLLQRRNITVVLVGMQYLPGGTVYKDVAQSRDVIYYPFMLEGVFMKPELNLGDRLHPNSQGYLVIVEHLLPVVEDAIELHLGRG